MELSVQTGTVVKQFGFEKGCRMFREAGFTAIDWNIDTVLKKTMLKEQPYEDLCLFERPMEEIRAHYAEELAAIRENGLRITQAHAPFPGYVFERPESIDYTHKIYEKMIRFCDEVGCKNLVIHGIGLVYDDHVNTPASILELNKKMYGSLIDVLKETNVTVCLENLFSSCPGGVIEGNCSNPYEAVALIDWLNGQAGKECFGLCLDTGHLTLLRRTFRQYVPILGKRIKALHIHDNNVTSDSHLMPYTGKTNWNDFCESLHAVGYSGDLSFETFNQTRTEYLAPELVPVFLHTIAQVGAYFRDKIQG